MQKWIDKYKLRQLRRVRRIRAWRLGRRLFLAQDNTHFIGEYDVTAYITVHNELQRIPYFLEYYRKMGIKHFIFLDNNSTDGTAQYLSRFSDVTRYFTKQSYRRAHFGMDWVNWLLFKHAQGKWALVVDIDEFLVFPHNDKRPIGALTDWLDASSKRFLGTIMVDLYPSLKLNQINQDIHRDPFKFLTHFDQGNYTYLKNKVFGNLWIQGGVRARLFFKDKPDQAPALNKTPLVKWRRGDVFISSTHQLLPTHLNVGYALAGGEQINGVLLHTKFLPDLAQKIDDDYLRSQHYSKAREYVSYNRTKIDDLDFMDECSIRYANWSQFVQLGMMSQGGWA